MALIPKLVKKNKLNHHISTKIILAIVLVTFITITTITGILAYLLSDIIGNEAKEFTLTTVQSNLNAFQQSFSSVESAVGVIVSDVESDFDLRKAKSDPNYLTQYKEILTKRLKHIGESSDLTRSVYVYFNTNLFNREVDIWMLENEKGQFERQGSFGVEYYQTYNAWYNEPIDNQNTLWTFPYTSVDGNNVITSYVTPIIVNGETVAMVGMDLYLDDIAKILDQIQLFDTGYLYLMHPDGRTIVHPRVDFGTNILDVGDFQFLLDTFNQDDTGYITYSRDDGLNVFAVYGHLKNGWILASSIPESEVLHTVKSIIFILISIGLIAIILAVIVSTYIGKTITKPLSQIVDATEKLKSGDFTTQVDIHTKDETQVLATGLNQMSTSISALIKEVKLVSSNIVESASTLAAMSEETNASVEQVSNNIKEIDSGTQDTAKNAEKGSMIAHQIDQQFTTLMSNSSEMRTNATNVIEVNRFGQQTLELLRIKSNESQNSNLRVSEAVLNLEVQTKEITNIISTITSIAEQTNLLALNASIEAARAGDAGRGFAVVAEEIRKLAENSTKSVNEISQIVNNIQHESKETVQIMTEVSALNRAQSDAVDDVNEAFSKIFGSVEAITKQIEAVTNELNELNHNKDSLFSVITNISAVAEETAAATEQVRHSISEQLQAVEQVATNAENMNNLSSDLNAKIDIFKVM